MTLTRPKTRPQNRNIKNSFILITVLSVGAMGFQVASALAYSAAVRQACTGDYLNFCAHTAPGSARLRSCMRKAGPRLSGRCVKALIGAGFVPKTNTQQRAAKR